MSNVQVKFPNIFVLRALSCVRSPTQHHYKKTESYYKSDDLSVSSGRSIEVSFSNNEDNNTNTQPESSPNRVMVVVDWSVEANSALQWALSHTVQSQDTIVLLHIAKPTKKGVNSNSVHNHRAYELLCSMKNRCQMKRPGVNVEISLEEGKEKGPIIVEETKRKRVSLLVMGQRKRSILWHLQMMWANKKRAMDRVVEHCIQNANCMTIAVRRKSKRRGGYLITTKRHKNFWLLA